MRLVMPTGSGSCSVGGVEYAPDADGIVTIPDDVDALELLAHGLTVATEPGEVSEAMEQAAQASEQKAEEVAPEQPHELAGVKAQLDALGVQYGPRIGLETAKARLAEAQAAAAAQE